MALLDADADGAKARISAAVETVRAGYIFARDQSQYIHWRHDVDPDFARTTLDDLARDYPDHVRPN